MNELWEILVPVTDSLTGMEFTKKFHQSWDELIRSISGGLTILHPVKGQWVAPNGLLFHEYMIPVRIVCDEKKIKEIIDLTMIYYNQQAVMAYRVSDKCIIKAKE